MQRANILNLSVRSNIFKSAALFYHNQLKTNSSAALPIDTIHEWGLQGREIVKLGLGYHDSTFDCLHKFMCGSTNCCSQQDLLLLHLAAKNKYGSFYDRMRNAIIIPTIDPDGHIICFDHYSLESKEFFHYPHTDYFKHADYLYSLNIAVATKKKVVFVTCSYEDYFQLFGMGIENAVCTYFPRISDNQLELLKMHFPVVIPFVPKDVTFHKCTLFCESNGMFCDEVLMHECNTPREYLTKYGTDELTAQVSNLEHWLR